MKKNSKLSASLHALMHMAHQADPMTSEALGLCLQTNPVVVRRTMAGLRENGLVQSGRGHGGGWTLARPITEITLRDVYIALNEPVPLQLEADAPVCQLERAVSNALNDAYAEAEAQFANSLANITLADLFKGIKLPPHYAAHGKEHK
ncbi:MAG: Rrf2 family transcriptional regulator [Burkholderiaceae bacterium]|uniref:Rrf2 family transcriptional regulator n=1 Tax=Herminiimonas contaminans TaxID=1111140 RepID=A0ABS0EVT5_9BURK|nr:MULTISPECIES: Rrf2 family transcriptional regulator [Oxalobacteraceae]MBF8178653.1 Rrf2 family transcriptional regulator [Herminiimonas contaminans]MBX9800137.1 Rrf2 family transcriptional regulator [Burkholderiaceae bacterium]